MENCYPILSVIFLPWLISWPHRFVWGHEFSQEILFCSVHNTYVTYGTLIIFCVVKQHLPNIHIFYWHCNIELLTKGLKLNCGKKKIILWTKLHLLTTLAVKSVMLCFLILNHGRLPGAKSTTYYGRVFQLYSLGPNNRIGKEKNGIFSPM